MIEMTLEEEFEQFKAQHMNSVLTAVLIDNYRKDEELKQGAKLPETFNFEKWYKQAQREIADILLLPNGVRIFEVMYASAWDKVKGHLQ